MLTIKQKRDALEQQWKYGQISTYEYEMGDLDLRFCSPELRETDEYKLNKLKIQREWMVISESEYEIQTFDIVNKNKTPRERELAALDVRLKHNEIDQATYEVDKAQLEGRALGMVRLIYDENEDPENGYFDVRFNKLFVNKLREKGFQGENDNQVVDNWVMTQYYNIANKQATEETEILPYSSDLYVEEEFEETPVEEEKPTKRKRK